MLKKIEEYIVSLETWAWGGKWLRKMSKLQSGRKRHKPHRLCGMCGAPDASDESATLWFDIRLYKTLVSLTGISITKTFWCLNIYESFDTVLSKGSSRVNKTVSSTLPVQGIPWQLLNVCRGGALLAETPLSRMWSCRILLSLGRIEFFSDGISEAGEANKFFQCRETMTHLSSHAFWLWMKNGSVHIETV